MRGDLDLADIAEVCPLYRLTVESHDVLELIKRTRTHIRHTTACSQEVIAFVEPILLEMYAHDGYTGMRKEWGADRYIVDALARTGEIPVVTPAHALVVSCMAQNCSEFYIQVVMSLDQMCDRVTCAPLEFYAEQGFTQEDVDFIAQWGIDYEEVRLAAFDGQAVITDRWRARASSQDDDDT